MNRDDREISSVYTGWMSGFKLMAIDPSLSFMQTREPLFELRESVQ